MPMLNDRVRENTTFTGLGNIVLDGVSLTRFLRWQDAFNNDTWVYYAVIHTAANEWEVGIGLFNRVTNQIVRNQVISSNTGTFINFTAGTKNTFCTIASFQAQSLGTWLALQSGTFFF